MVASEGYLGGGLQEKLGKTRRPPPDPILWVVLFKHVRPHNFKVGEVRISRSGSAVSHHFKKIVAFLELIYTQP